MDQEFQFLKIAENLKKELRHSWLSNGRQESVAEHSWRLCLMVFRFANRLDCSVNVEKCLKMALIHDLGEAITGDIPVFDTKTKHDKNIKFQNEYDAMQQIKNILDNDSQSQEMFELWHEYEMQNSYESRFIKALDKLEVFMQHNEANLSTLERKEKHMIFQEKWLRKYCRFDSFLDQLAEKVMQDSLNKLIAANEDIELLRKEALYEKN